MPTAISTELIDFSDMSNSMMDSVVNDLKQQQILQVTLRNNAFSYWTRGTADPYVNVTDNFARRIHAQGIAVHIDLHSWFTQISSMVRSAQTYINYVKATVAAYEQRGTPCDTYQVWNEPGYSKASADLNKLLIDSLIAARGETSKPLSGRFMGSANTVTRHFSRDIEAYLDYYCANMYYLDSFGAYWNPTRSSSTAENTMKDIIARAHSLGMQLWITEAGLQYDHPNEEAQRVAVASTVEWAKNNGVDLLNIWVSQPSHAGSERYNIYNGNTHTPRPAFYELKTDAYTPPNPMPTPDTVSLRTINGENTPEAFLTEISDAAFAAAKAKLPGHGNLILPTGEFDYEPTANGLDLTNFNLISEGKTEIFNNNPVPYQPDGWGFFFNFRRTLPNWKSVLSGVHTTGFREAEPDHAARVRGASFVDCDFIVHDTTFKDIGGSIINSTRSRGAVMKSKLVNTSGRSAGAGGVSTGENVVGYGVGVYGSGLASDWVSRYQDCFGKKLPFLVIVEDCQLEKLRHCVAANVGGSYVFRKNVVQHGFGFAELDMHGGGYGTLDQTGARSAEIYENTFGIPEPDWNSSGVSVFMACKGGDLLCYNNVGAGYYTYGIQFSADGDNPAYYPKFARVWGNT